jgi:quinol monooxygenase YgiN
VADDVELVVVTMAFEARGSEADEALRRHLARYVVLARDEPGCRNIDLVASATHALRYLVVEKWESDDHRRAHFDAEPLVELARSCDGLLAAPPAIDLHEPISAHDLR